MDCLTLKLRGNRMKLTCESFVKMEYNLLFCLIG